MKRNAPPRGATGGILNIQATNTYVINKHEPIKHVIIDHLGVACPEVKIEHGLVVRSSQGAARFITLTSIYLEKNDLERSARQKLYQVHWVPKHHMNPLEIRGCTMAGPDWLLQIFRVKCYGES